MKTFNRENIHVIIISIVLFTFTSCNLKPIASEYNFVKTNFENVTLEKLGGGKVLIYNGATFMHRIDKTARLNVWINGKALGQIRAHEYVIIDLAKGHYEVKLHHIDVVNIRSIHNFEMTDSIKVIQISPTPLSNKLEVTNELPEKFEKFIYAVKR